MRIWKLLRAFSTTGLVAGLMTMLSLTSVNAAPTIEETAERRNALTELLSESETSVPEISPEALRQFDQTIAQDNEQNVDQGVDVPVEGPVESPDVESPEEDCEPASENSEGVTNPDETCESDEEDTEDADNGSTLRLVVTAEKTPESV